MGTTIEIRGGRDAFFAQYAHYTPEGARKIGAELEVNIMLKGMNGSGPIYVPAAEQLLEAAFATNPASREWLRYEFSACQVEVVTDPCLRIGELVDQLLGRFEFIREVADQLGYELVAVEWIPLEVKLPEVVYPDERYLAFAATHPEHARRMHRVASLQFHVGVGSLQEALRVHRQFVGALPELLANGWAHPDRVAAFNDVIFAPGWFPPVYDTVDDLYTHAQERGFDHQPANNWSAVRPHHKWPTVELRIGGTTLDRGVIFTRARKAYTLAFG